MRRFSSIYTLVWITITLPALYAHSFESTFEAYQRNNNLCIGDCLQKADGKRCVYDSNAHETECKPLAIRTQKYRTINNEVCSSNCGYFEGKDYQWCVKQGGGWDYCMRQSAVEVMPSYKTDNKYLFCRNECAKRKASYYYCNTIRSSWERCDPNEKTLLFIHRTSDLTLCAGPCRLYKDNIAHCYDHNNKWLKCFLNPEYKQQLNRIHNNLVKNYGSGGEYTQSGYQMCSRRGRRSVHNDELLNAIHQNGNNPMTRVRRNLYFTYPLNVAQVAAEYESLNTTVYVRDLDPDYMITHDRDPIISYSVLPTYSYFGSNPVNLPLVVRAVITTHTLRGPGERESFTAAIDRHYQSMSPIVHHRNHDERGHIVGSRLGGPTEAYNIFPQSWHHNRGALSRWQYFESNLDTFLRGHLNRYAEYTAVLSYQTDASGALLYRATGIALRVRLHQAGELVDMRGAPVTAQGNSLENMYFTNNPDNLCFVEGDHSDY